jgi:iron complex outermembrane receptor protein
MKMEGDLMRESAVRGSLNVLLRRAGAALGSACLALPLSAPAAAQRVPEEIIVTATRIPLAWERAPLAVGHVDRAQVQTGRQQLGLDESLAVVPGLFFQNRYNFAQELRISIRGFGARANFGIRGIRLIADDIPLTMPDGQGNVDSIDLGSVASIEVIRGPVSAMYGAAGGGAIILHSEEGPEEPFVSGRFGIGANGFRQGQLKSGAQNGDLNWLASLSGSEIDGHRDHSRYERSLLNSRVRYDFAASSLTLVFNAVDAPEAQDPGALTAAEVAADRHQAAPRNVLFDAGEAWEQQRLGLSWRKPLSGGLAGNQDLLLRAWAIRRDFMNRLPFDLNSNGQGGSVDLDRKVGGVGGQWRWDRTLAEGRQNRLLIGFDLDAQRDRRRRFVNNLGRPGPLTTDQDEDVSAFGLFVENAWDLAAHWTLSLGARYDDLEYEVEDRTAGEGSGSTSFSELSPMAGLSWAVGPGFNVYGNVATSYDPPTFTELANPEAATGFNRNLDPQTATNYELGFKGMIARRLRYELALFHIAVQDEIVPFELAASGQAFFRNAGRSTHDGLEAALLFEFLPGLDGALTYTGSDFTFDRFRGVGGEVFDGNRIPGVPKHQVHVELDWRPDSGLYAGIDLLYAGEFHANDANTVLTGDYLVANLRAGYRHSGARWAFEPFIGVNNLTDETYDANVRINAAFGRYFEPAPGRDVYGGIELRFDY